MRGQAAPSIFTTINLPMTTDDTRKATYMAGTWNVPNMICVILSQFAMGLSSASVKSPGCPSSSSRHRSGKSA
eukprot:CAMPEP_0204550574 /NCGR_PEP_ID=MMETSP0661-20131031/25230_1 /ASSEMBLY_ACC=CAM_ASM_000606 /TAXON_ID=109239 /ORGANISM="Alexandrium margalefi, Strain AMGDE01CS-322" /LENGTH=72 /DNA_ID=CAMNT_0051557541 /DNA_START=39 /DNA_END=254 /DNA_ORIENTATION=-